MGEGWGTVFWINLHAGVAQNRYQRSSKLTRVHDMHQPNLVGDFLFSLDK